MRGGRWEYKNKPGKCCVGFPERSCFRRVINGWQLCSFERGKNETGNTDVRDRGRTALDLGRNSHARRTGAALPGGRASDRK